MSTSAENIETIRELLGPKRVKTPKIEVEQFDLKELDRIAEKSNTFKPSFNNFMFAVASPNGVSCVCPNKEYFDPCCDN